MRNRIVIVFILSTWILSSCSSVNIPSSEDLIENEDMIAKSAALPNDVVHSYLEYTRQTDSHLDSSNPQTGQRMPFWVPVFRENRFAKVEAELISVGTYCNLWLDIDDLAEKDSVLPLFSRYDREFAPKIYSFFRFTREEGIDHDVNPIILVSDKISGDYFYSFSEVPRVENLFSNQHEIIYLNTSGFSSGEDASPRLGHEMQHLLHWMVDPDEETWVSEGLSTLAETLINPYDVPLLGFNQRPDTQLNAWDINGDNYAHYGASFLYFRYLADQFGDSILPDLIKSKQNGFEGVDQELGDLDRTLENGRSIADQVFINWTVANLLNRKDLEQGQFGYKDIVFPEPFVSQEIDTCNSGWINLDVNQYGTDYFSINCPEKFRLEFSGQKFVRVVRTDPVFSPYFFWSNRANESKMTLTKRFDFTNARAPKIEMNVWMWYDLEPNFDFSYIRVSEDGSAWKTTLPEQFQKTCSIDGKTCGFNGTESDWRKETVDISECAGKSCEIQFVYATDLAAYGDGLAVGKIEIPSIHYIEDFRQQDGGWKGEGFVRILNALPQKYSVSIVKTDDPMEVEYLFPDSENHLISNTLRGNVLLLISGLTQKTTQPAPYRIRVIPE